MGRITAKGLQGVWAALPMCWDGNWGFDEEAYAGNVERTIAGAGVQGVYTTGSTGEFYAIKYEEFCRMVDIQAELCGKAGMLLQIGCCSDATRKTIRLLEYAASKREVGGAQVCVPYWMELTDREVVQFFKDVHTACPDMPLIHYNIMRTKRFLHGEDYLRILEVSPNLVGVKYTAAGENFTSLEHDISMTPDITYFVGETLLPSGMQIGARGCYSSLVLMNPPVITEMYRKAKGGEWKEAFAMQRHVSLFLYDLVDFVTGRGEGMMDPVADKGMAAAAGFLALHQRTRPPYIGWTDETVTALRAWLKERYPRFVYGTSVD